MGKCSIDELSAKCPLKRVFDFLVTSLLLLAIVPLIAITALAVGLAMGRPVFLHQIRPGRHGRPFVFYKFRTMTQERDASGALLPDDQRLTAFGRRLRATSLDELPQLWNVIKGDMSLVGPRPLLMEYHATLYTLRAGAAPRGAARHHRLGTGERAQRPFVGGALRARRLVCRSPDRSCLICASCC
jgi:lipopolysaccharide/colanic/teichoic acid biosynthesis glycosyltransferase